MQEEFEPTRGTIKPDNSLVMRHVTVIKSFLQGLHNIITKYDKAVYDVVAPIFEVHIVQTLFLQK